MLMQTKENVVDEIKQNKIDYRFKLLYALGMVFIVSGHCSGGGVSLFYDWFSPYSFHLGLFMFASGYFYKCEAEDALIKYVIKKIKSLILPLYLWNVVYAIISKVLFQFGFVISGEITLEKIVLGPIMHGHQFIYNLGSWFIVPLFMVQIYNVLIRKIFGLIYKKNDEWLYFMLAFSIGVVGVCLAKNGLYNGWWLVIIRMMFFIPFYSAGILYKRKLEKNDVLPSPIYFGIIFLAQLAVIFYCGRIPTYSPAWCNDFLDVPYMPFLVGFLGIAFWLRVSSMLEPVLGRNKYINLIADNTYSIMMNHLLGFMLVKTVFAVINKYTEFCNNFDWVAYKSQIWYCYLPKNIHQMLIIYLVVGISLPILIQLAIDKIKTTIINKVYIRRNDR